MGNQSAWRQVGERLSRIFARLQPDDIQGDFLKSSVEMRQCDSMLAMHGNEEDSFADDELSDTSDTDSDCGRVNFPAWRNLGVGISRRMQTLRGASVDDEPEDEAHMLGRWSADRTAGLTILNEYGVLGF